MAVKRPESARIDLAEFGGPVYVGRSRGEKVRAETKLNELDQADRFVEVIIPEDTIAVNSSFFLGMFGQSIRRAGSSDRFLEKYQFNCPEWVWETIERGIQRALFEQRELF